MNCGISVNDACNVTKETMYLRRHLWLEQPFQNIWNFLRIWNALYLFVPVKLKKTKSSDVFQFVS